MQKPLNALSYLYHKAQSEKDIKIIKMYNVVKSYIQYEKIKQLEKFCEITESVAVHSKKMTEHQRKKYKYNQINLNGKTFYIFNRHQVWAVGIVTDPNIYIYSDDF